MDIKKLIFITLKKWPIIVVFALVGAISFYFYAIKAVTPIYSAEATMMVTKPVDRSTVATPYTMNDVLLTQKLVKSYIIIMNSKANLWPVIDKLQLSITPAQLRSYIKITGIGETEILKITVMHQDRYLARDIADAMAEVSPKTIIKIISAVNAEVIDKADLPTSPVSPVVSQYCVAGAFLGIILSLALILTKNYFDFTYKTEEDISNSLDLPILTCLPKIYGRRIGDLIADAPFDYKEAFKVLRTKFQFAASQNDLKKIGVSSPNPSEGKTSIAVNLALTLAETGLKVLLIDTDLRKPKIYKSFDFPIAPGLTTLLSEQETIENVLRKVTGYESLDVITSGEVPENPAELLGSSQMKTLVENFTYSYDYIIFDTPPINIVTDVAVLSTILDGVVYVVSYGQTLVEAAKLAKKTLDSVEANIVGCVFNNVDVKSHGNSEYYRNRRKKYKGYGYYTNHNSNNSKNNRRKNKHI